LDGELGPVRQCASTELGLGNPSSYDLLEATGSLLIRDTGSFTRDTGSLYRETPAPLLETPAPLLRHTGSLLS